MGLLSNYCGLGGEGPIQNRIDAICKQHDKEYAHMTQMGFDPYFHWNYADENMIRAMKKIQGPMEWKEKLLNDVAATVWHVKKNILPESSLRPTTELVTQDPGELNEEKTQEMPHEHGGKRMRLEGYIPQHGSDQSAVDGGPVGQNMGAVGAEEGIEEQTDKPKNIWRRFPNTQNCALKWVLTQFLAKSGSGNTSVPPNDPYDNVTKKTNSSLLTGGGGTQTQPNFDFISENSANTGYDFTQPYLIQIRMTSPYNKLKTQGSGGSSGVSVGNSQPTWLEFFDSKYQYYHVMECQWEMKFVFGNNYTNTGSVNRPDCGYYIFWKYTNEDDPALSWTGTTSNIANTTFDAGNPVSAAGDAGTADAITTVSMTNAEGSQALTPDDYFRQDGWKHKHVHLSSIKDSEVTLHGRYKFGQCKMDLKTIMASDSHGNATTAESWSQTGATAAFPENLSVIIVADNMYQGVGGIDQNVSVRYETEDLIQFKDLRYGYKFPTPALNTLPATGQVTTDQVYFIRGAGYS